MKIRFRRILELEARNVLIALLSVSATSCAIPSERERGYSECARCEAAFMGACDELSAHSIAVTGRVRLVRTVSAVCLDDYFDPSSGMSCESATHTNLYELRESLILRGSVQPTNEGVVFFTASERQPDLRTRALSFTDGQTYVVLGEPHGNQAELHHNEVGHTVAARAACSQ